MEAMVISSIHYPRPNLILTEISMLTRIVDTPLISKNNLRQLIVNNKEMIELCKQGQMSKRHTVFPENVH